MSTGAAREREAKWPVARRNRFEVGGGHGARRLEEGMEGACEAAAAAAEGLAKGHPAAMPWATCYGAMRILLLGHGHPPTGPWAAAYDVARLLGGEDARYAADDPP